MKFTLWWFYINWESGQIWLQWARRSDQFAENHVCITFSGYCIFVTSKSGREYLKWQGMSTNTIGQAKSEINSCRVRCWDGCHNDRKNGDEPSSSLGQYFRIFARFGSRVTLAVTLLSSRWHYCSGKVILLFTFISFLFHLLFCFSFRFFSLFVTQLLVLQPMSQPRSRPKQ